MASKGLRNRARGWAYEARARFRHPRHLEALEATFYDIAERSIDRIVCLGDIVGYNSDAAACIALIRGADCVCVAGNHDLAVCGRITTRNFSSAAARAVAWTRQQLCADDLDFLESLPPKANIGNRVIAVHGALHPETGCESVRLDNDKRRMQSFDALMTHPTGARICAFGHTHQAAVYELRGNLVAITQTSTSSCATRRITWSIPARSASRVRPNAAPPT